MDNGAVMRVAQMTENKDYDVYSRDVFASLNLAVTDAASETKCGLFGIFYTAYTFWMLLLFNRQICESIS